MAIRYDSRLNTEIRRVVSNYNKRVRRLLAKNNDLAIEPVTVRELKSRYTKRRDLLYELQNLELIRNDPSSVERVLKRDLRRAKIKLNYQIKQIEEQAGTQKFTVIKSVRLRNLQARRASFDKNFKKLSRAEKENLRKQIDKVVRPDPEKQREFYDKFFDMLFADIYQSDYDPEKAAYIRERLIELDPDTLLKAYNENQAIRAIIDEYHGIESATPAHIEDSLDRTGKALDNLFDNVDRIIDEYK